MYPTDDIKYKIGFLNMKEQAGNMLAPDEFKYRNSVNEFIKHYDAVKLDKELQKVAMYKDTIIDYLNKRELEISQDIPKTRVIKKCAAMQNALECIRYLKKGGLKYFFYYIMDNYPKDDIDTYDYISSVIIKNKGKNADAQYIYNYGNVFECDPATHQVNFNSSLIALIRGYLTNDRTLYNKVEKYYRLVNKNPEQKNELLKCLPADLREIDIEALIKYLRSVEPTGENSLILDEDRDVLDFFAALDDLNQDAYEPTHGEEIVTFVEQQIENLFANKIRVREIEKYRVLDFFKDHNNLDICRRKFKKYNYDFDAIIKSLLKDNFIEGSDFYDEYGFSMPNINLACEYLSGHTKNYKLLKKYEKEQDVAYLDSLPDDLIGANASALDKIVYYGKGRIMNPHNHELDETIYSLKMLQAIGNYYNSSRVKEQKAELEEASKAPKVA